MNEVEFQIPTSEDKHTLVCSSAQTVTCLPSKLTDHTKHQAGLVPYSYTPLPVISCPCLLPTRSKFPSSLWVRCAHPIRAGTGRCFSIPSFSGCTDALAKQQSKAPCSDFSLYAVVLFRLSFFFLLPLIFSSAFANFPGPWRPSRVALLVFCAREWLGGEKRSCATA